MNLLVLLIKTFYKETFVRWFWTVQRACKVRLSDTVYIFIIILGDKKKKLIWTTRIQGIQ